MTAKNGNPCPKCGSNEWNSGDDCAPCARERSRQWKKNNPEKHAEINRRWAHNNPEKAYRLGRVWGKKNPEKNRELKRKWQRNNPDKVNAKTQKRRALKTDAGGSYTIAEWKALVDCYGGRCLCCGRADIKLTVDHVVPIVKGGRSDISNIQPLCMTCNQAKGVKTIDYRPGSSLGRWVQRKLFG